jgi:formate dehydrogenase iron-sulfur subunit
VRNLRRSWLSREVALLSLYAAAAIAAIVLPSLAVVAMVLGVAGVYASARLYIVPGRPAWNSWTTLVRFLATAVALGPALSGRATVAAGGVAVALVATAINWVRLASNRSLPWLGAVRLELRWFGPWTLARWTLSIAGTAALLAGSTLAGWVAIAAGELIGRWLFFVAVVPLNMPGAFWRGAAGTHR